MTAREQVLHAYGSACTWCGSTERLEIDHVAGGQGQGNAHRQRLTSRIEYWLRKEYTRTGDWPAGVQLLCTTPAHTGCHDRKSGRKKRMPPKHGNASVNISLPAELAEQLTRLASMPGASKSSVVETALRQLIEGSTAQTLLDSLHQRLDSLTAALKNVEQSTKAHGLQVQGLGERVTTQEEQFAAFRQDVRSLYDQHRAARNGQASGLWGSLLGRK